MYDDVKKHCQDCAQCQYQSFKQSSEEMHSTWISALWKKVMMNMTHMPMNQEKHYIIEAWDSLLRWPETRALASLNSESIVKFLWEKIICQHRYFQKLICDEESENKNVIKVDIIMYFQAIIVLLSMLCSLYVEEDLPRDNKLSNRKEMWWKSPEFLYLKCWKADWYAESLKRY